MLGATEQDFARELGPPNDHSTRNEEGRLLLGHYRRCPGKNLDEFIVMFAYGRAVNIDHQSCGPIPSAKERAREAGHFAPDDTSKGQPFTSQRGEQGAVFVSQTLAEKLTADWFNGCTEEGAAPAPGTFTFVATESGWSLGTGTCP
jgi:hypothetical protein